MSFNRCHFSQEFDDREQHMRAWNPRAKSSGSLGSLIPDLVCGIAADLKELLPTSDEVSGDYSIPKSVQYRFRSFSSRPMISVFTLICHFCPNMKSTSCRASIFECQKGQRIGTEQTLTMTYRQSDTSLAFQTSSLTGLLSPVRNAEGRSNISLRRRGRNTSAFQDFEERSAFSCFQSQYSPLMLQSQARRFQRILNNFALKCIRMPTAIADVMYDSTC